MITQAVAAWLDRITRDVLESGAYPRLTEAIRTEKPTFEAAPMIASMLGYGWTLERIEAALDRAITAGTNGPMGPHSALNLIRLAYLEPDEFDQWASAYNGNLWSLTGDNRILIDMWRSYRLGTLGPLCVAAGLTPQEAQTRHRNGTLDEASLRALAALRADAVRH